MVVHKDFRVDGLAFNGLNILMAKSELDSEREEFLLLLSNAIARRKQGLLLIWRYKHTQETGDRRMKNGDSRETKNTHKKQRKRKHREPKKMKSMRRRSLRVCKNA